MARRQGALGSPVQLRRSADGDRGLPGGRRRGPPPRDDGSGDCRLPPGRVDEPRGTRAVVQTPGRPESRVARGLSKGLKSGDFLPRAAGSADDRDRGFSEGRDARRDDRRRAGFSRGPESLVQATGRLRSVWDQEVFGRCTTVVQEAGGGDGPAMALPGGHLEFGETLAACLSREFFEECGLNVEAEKLVYVHENFYTVTKIATHEIGFYFLVDLNSEFPTPDSKGY